MKRPGLRTMVTTRVDVVVDCGVGPSLLEADLGYDPRDPLAVSITFLDLHATTWVIGRDLLLDGLEQPSGFGDVHVWPRPTPTGDAVVVVELSSPDGSVVVEFARDALLRFARRTVASVPSGSESALLDVDGTIGLLLSG